MKIAVMCGHGKSLDGSWDCGCTWDKYNEASLMLPITKSAVKYLRLSGITVISDADNNNNKNMIADVKWANQEKCKLYVSIHCDYYKAPSGVYPLYVSSNGKKLATALNSSIKADLKIKSRGLGKRTDLWELNGTDMPACILETSCIKDSVLRTKSDEYGKAIAKGICKYLGVTFKSATLTPSATKKVNYVASTNGKKIPLYKDYNSKSIKSEIKGAFTIIEEHNGYGKLKSGSGWIKLSDVKKVNP